MALIVGFVVAVIASPLAARVATRLGVVAHPGPLRVHQVPVPYFGGLAVFVAILAPVVGARPSFLVPLALACALGLADDVTSLPPLVRIGAEVGIACGAAWVSARHDGGHLLLAVIVVLVLINALNMLDGLDGLAAGVAIAGAVGFFVVLHGSSATLALALAGALGGFLVWNRPPARVYLGDGGSYLVGTALAMLFVGAAQRDAAVTSGAFLFVAIPVADSVVAVVRRLRARQSLLRGDRGHVYDQLVDRGWSAPTSVLACISAQAVLSGAGVGIASLDGGVAVVVASVLVVGIAIAALLVFTSPRAWSP